MCTDCSCSTVKLDGVTSVDVDVTTGTVAVRSSTPLDDDKVRAAIEDAGYQLDTA